MFVSDNLGVNDKGHLTIGGVDTISLAQEYKTPLYVMDEDSIRGNCRRFKKSIDKYYSGNGKVLFASKAFSCVHMYKILKEEGLGADVVSGGELYTALLAGFDPADIYFHGNNKTDDELVMALDNKIGRILVDNVEELYRLSTLAAERNVTVDISFRIKPGVDAHTHDFIMTGQIDSKFGVALENGEAMDFVGKISSCKNINLVGIHCHIGSQIFDIEPFGYTAKVMLNFAADVRDKYGIMIKELNLGGGFGIKYKSDHNPAPFEEYMRIVSGVVKETAKQRGIPVPFILIEPGRAIVAPAGITLYTVGSVKTIKDIRTYVAIDGGMTDNPRYALYQSEYEAVCANRAQAPKDMKVTIAGRCCESGDLIGKDMPLQSVSAGDIVAVFSTGAYNYSMASNYNRVPRPPVVMVSGGKSFVAVKRETYEDIVRNDVL